MCISYKYSYQTIGLSKIWAMVIDNGNTCFCCRSCDSISANDGTAYLLMIWQCVDATVLPFASTTNAQCAIMLI